MDSKFKQWQDRNGDWQPCQRGTILAPKQFLEKRAAGRKSALLQLFIFYGCGALVVCAIVFSFLGDSNRLNKNARPLPRQLSCSEVDLKLVAYAQNKVACCSERAAIAQHLNKCALCDRRYQLLLENDANGAGQCSANGQLP